ncbi:MAG: M56 family metallopeptidase [Gemmatimonadaceae bacterium]
MLVLDAMAGIGQMLPLITTLVLVVGVIAVVVARAFASRNAAARSIVWQGALLASIIMPAAAVLGPTLRLTTAEASAPALRAAQRAFAPMSNAATHRGMDLTTMLGLLWLCGFVLLSLRLIRHVVSAERLRRRAVPTRAHAAFARARRDAGYNRDVPLLVSLDIDVPLALGLLRPAIIVPASSSEWSDDEWYLVLLHEMAHLERRDLVARAIGMTAGVLHWFNPLVPWLRRRLERDAELAADAVVLHAGVLPSRYADLLIDMAERALWSTAPEPSLTFARAEGLERRIGELLESAPSVQLMRRSTATCMTIASALFAAMLGCVQFSVRAPSVRAPRGSAPLTVDARDWRVGARSALVELSNDPSPQVRAAAAQSLAQMAKTP